MKKELRQFILGAIVISLATVAGYLIAPIEVRFINSLTHNTTLIGLTYAVGTIFFALLSVWLGRLSDRVGRDKFVIVGCILGIVYPILYASTYNIFQYMGIKFVWAFSAVATGPIFMAHLQDLMKSLKKKGHYISVVYAIQSILGAGAAFLGGYLSDAFGLRAPYIAMAAVFILAAILSFTQFSLKSRNIHEKYEKRHLLFGFHYMFKKPSLIFYFFQNTAFSLNWGIKGMLWPLIIYGMVQKDTVTGSVFATMGIVAFVLLLFIGKLVDKRGPFTSALLSMFLLGGAGLVLAFTGNVIVFWIFAAVFAAGEALNGPTQAVLLTDHIESKYRGELLGLDAFFDSTFNTLSPLLAGLLLTFWGPQRVLLLYIILFWIALIACKFIYYTKIRKK